MKTLKSYFDIEELSEVHVAEVVTPSMGRRRLLRAVGVGLGAAPLAQLLGCGGTQEAVDAGSTTPSDAAGADSAAGTEDASTSGGWATGGTAAMVASESYPDPFAEGSGTSCEVLCAATIGPCHTLSPERADVSDGWDGLPVRLALRLVDESCEPIEDAIVEIWHTNYRGIYSGEINTMCNSATEDRQAEYFRGYLRTDADGRVDFDTVYPGWYSSRAVHIHFRVMTGEYDAADNAQASVISQLFFPEDLTTSIFDSEPLYSDFGQPDTSLGTDNVIGGEDDPSPYICDIAQMSDGVMLASKTLVVRVSGSTCNVSGAGGGGPGGMPMP